MKKLEFEFTRICRKAGGLFFGVAYSFPVGSISDDLNYHFNSVMLRLGLIFWKLDIFYYYNVRKVENNNDPQ